MKLGTELVCPVCGQPFAVKSSAGKYCSEACYTEARNKKAREVYNKQRSIKKTAADKAKAKRAAEWTRIGKMMDETGLSYGKLVAKGMI